MASFEFVSAPLAGLPAAPLGQRAVPSEGSARLAGHPFHAIDSKL